MNKYCKMIPIYSLILLFMFICCLLSGEVVQVISSNIAPQNRTCFIIDPGHGGIDGGAVSCIGTNESKINLEISLRLKDLLELLGYKTLMTRETDKSIHTYGETITSQKASDLKERVRIVNETDNGILLSIHQNHYHNSIYWGSQMFYAQSDGSQMLANQLQQSFNDTINSGSNRKMKKADGIYLMKHTQKPSVLIECGFLSNYNEAAKLESKVYQQAICCVIGSVCSSYANQLQIT